MSRLPLPLRLTFLFSAAMSALLIVLGSLLYVRMGNALDEQIDDGLEQQAAAVGTDPRAASLDDGFLAIGNTTVSGASVALPRDALERARHGTTFATVGGYRVLLEPRPDGRVLAVGRSLDDRDEALASLLTELLVVGGLALGLAGVAGYTVARAATRPVLERLQRGVVRERRFVADASHELRTPLATLQAELDLALGRPRSPAQIAAALASATEEVQRLRRLADDLLVLARADEDGLELRTERLRARELLDAVGRRFAARAAASGREIEVESDDVAFEGDRLRLEQAIGNLVDNALRHGTGVIRLRAARDTRVVRVGVFDDGGGIPPDLGDRAFERFTRSDLGRRGDGSGLGLAIVEAVARAHGGTARATSGGVVIELASRA